METNKQPKSASLLKKALIYRPFHKLTLLDPIKITRQMKKVKR